MKVEDGTNIRQFGFVNLVLIDEGHVVFAGAGRIRAAERLGMTRVPTLRLDQMRDVDKRAFTVADSKLTLNAGWDDELLAIELVELSELVGDFDIERTGFDTVDIERLTPSATTRVDPADS